MASRKICLSFLALTTLGALASIEVARAGSCPDSLANPATPLACGSIMTKGIHGTLDMGTLTCAGEPSDCGSDYHYR
jgi:hypothetical protein